MSEHQRRKIILRLVFALVVLVLVFGGAELALRRSGLGINTGDITYTDRFLYNPVGKGDYKWDEYITLGVHVYPLSPREYNLDQPVRPKPPGVTRVVCLGDSSTIGAEVRRDQPYPQVLQRILPQCWPDRKIEVLNFGRHGYTSYQGRLLMEQTWDLVRPDVLVFYFGANDMTIAPFREDKDWVKIPRWSLRLHQFLYTRSVLYRMLRNINLNYVSRRISLAVGKRREPDVRMRVTVPDFFANRDALRDRIVAAGGFQIPIVSAGVTHFKVVPMTCYLDYAAGPDEVDEVALFSGEYRAGRLPFADFVHPNAYGHQLLARAIVEQLARRWGPPRCNLGAVFAADAARP
jgi:lysophospholipase L1-like esterase